MTDYYVQSYIYGLEAERSQFALGMPLGVAFVAKDTGRLFRSMAGGFWQLPASSGDPVFTARVASTANVNVAVAPAVIDGVALVKGDVVLLKNQGVATENGLYVFDTVGIPLVRQTNWSGASAISPGFRVIVKEGTESGAEWAVAANADPIVFGASTVQFCRAQGRILFGAGTVGGGGTVTVFAPIVVVGVPSAIVLTDSTATPNPLSAAIADRVGGFSFIARGTIGATFDWTATLG